MLEITLETATWGLFTFGRQARQPRLDIDQFAADQIGAETLQDLFHDGVLLRCLITALSFIRDCRLTTPRSTTGTYHQAQTTPKHGQTGIGHHSLLFRVGKDTESRLRSGNR